MADLAKPSKFRRDYQVIVQRSKRFWNFLWEVRGVNNIEFDNAMNKVEIAICNEAMNYLGNRSSNGKRLEPYQSTSNALNAAATILVRKIPLPRVCQIDALFKAAVSAECLLDAVAEHKIVCQKAKSKVWIHRHIRRSIVDVSKSDIHNLSVNISKSKELKSRFDAIELSVQVLNAALVDSQKE